MENLAVSAVAFTAIVGEAYSNTVSTICTSVTRWTGCTIIVVCMIMTTGCASTKSNRGSSDQHILLPPYTLYLPAIPVATAPADVASSARLSFLCVRVPRPMEPEPGEGSWPGTEAKVCV